MYSEAVQKTLSKSGIRIGDRITVSKDKNIYEGLLMPRIEVGDPNSIVLKLDSGYNIGIKFAKGIKVGKSHKREPEEIKEEVRFEMGKERVRGLKFDKTKPPVTLIVTGGTIISRVDYKTGGVAPLESPEELLANVPELTKIINLRKIIIPFRKASEDLDHMDWQKLAAVIAKESNESEGFIIAHGTDTMHFTSAALSFMLKDVTKPVVLVGSQRSGDRGSSDAWMNLICAAYLSISDIAEVGICMHGETSDTFCYFHRGTRVRKTHATRRDAFQSFEDKPIAKVFPNGQINSLSNYKKRTNRSMMADTSYDPKVALIKVYPDSDPGILDYYLQKKYRGIVIEGTGMGHVPTKASKSWIPAIKHVTKSGIPVVITTQTLYGRVHSNVYENLRILYNETGAISGEDMLPEVALVKLGFVLGHKHKNLDEIRKMMLTNIAGEITERTVV